MGTTKLYTSYIDSKDDLYRIILFDIDYSSSKVTTSTINLDGASELAEDYYDILRSKGFKKLEHTRYDTCTFNWYTTYSDSENGICKIFKFNISNLNNVSISIIDIDGYEDLVEQMFLLDSENYYYAKTWNKDE